MPVRPLLLLPNPTDRKAPPGTGRGAPIRFPSLSRQGERFSPIFSRLNDVLSRPNAALELKSDPTSLAPERVVVFEIAGTVDDFLRALRRIDGLEFMAEIDEEFASDDDFAVQHQKSKKDRPEKNVPGHFYLAMPDIEALRQLVGLWQIWQTSKKMPRNFGAFGHLFLQLRDLRPWGAQDRVPSDVVAFWLEENARSPDKARRIEIELWYRSSEERRRAASQILHTLAAEAGGKVLHESTIEDIAYHGMLVEVPAAYVQDLLATKDVRLALADEVMFLRPQSLLEKRPGEQVVQSVSDSIAPGPGGPPPGAPVAALLDGVPIQAHQLLAGKLMFDDPDDLQSRALVARRFHGTGMASLILHGDRNEQNDALSRPLYFRPIMMVDPNGEETSDIDRLLVDTVLSSDFANEGQRRHPAIAPNVFLVNFSMGDRARPFSRLMSPLARAIDFLAHKYDILFLISAGNVLHELAVNTYQTWTEFEDATPADRERAVLSALHSAKHERTLLSPAESLNGLSIGGQHHDSISNRPASLSTVDPLVDSYLPNISSGLGLGHRRTIKPELFFPGGRERVRLQSTVNGLKIKPAAPQMLFGLRAATPDSQNQGRLDQVALYDGTSSATALATRAGHDIFDALMDRDGGSVLSEIDPHYYAVVVKTLMVHAARWTNIEGLLKEVCGPEDKRQYVQRTENSSRFIGFGVPEIARVLECSSNRATLVGFGTLSPEQGHVYRVPLPGCLEHVTDPRSLIVTVAWLSPIRAGHMGYRGLRFEASPTDKPIRLLGVDRKNRPQPADPSIRRGSVFHEQFAGSSAVPFVDQGHLGLEVWCKEDAGVVSGATARYGVAVTIEADGQLPIYEEIQQRLRVGVTA